MFTLHCPFGDDKIEKLRFSINNYFLLKTFIPLQFELLVQKFKRRGFLQIFMFTKLHLYLQTCRSLLCLHTW